MDLMEIQIHVALITHKDTYPCKFNEYRSKRLAATLVEPTLKTDINGIPNGLDILTTQTIKIVNRVSYRTLTHCERSP